MSPEESIKLVDMLKRHEGFRPILYKCPAGYNTIGYGHNCDAHFDVEKYSNITITQTEAENLLLRDLNAASLDCIKFVRSFDCLSTPHQAVLLDMCYNLGIGKLLEFKKMLHAFILGDNKAAAREMFHSKWASQVSSRCTELLFMALAEEWI
jgi:lysozyme